MDSFTIPVVMVPLLVNAAVLIATLLYGCREDIRERAVPVVMWYPAIAIGILMLAWFWFLVISSGDLSYMIPLIPFILFFAFAFFLFNRLNLFAIADAKALILITLLIPCFPFVPLTGYPVLGIPPYVFFPFSVLINAVVLNLLLPVGFFFMNLVKGNRAPVHCLFFGFPVQGRTIADEFGFVMEEITEKNGKLERRYIGFFESMKDLVAGSNRIYTKELKEDPEKYRREIALYEKAGTVWISYAVPFLIPITGGLITALVFGDLLMYLFRMIPS
jgi:preflagellin peptidase FlaK